ncbi:hypothetical protein SAMN04244579_03355 [Azotobacter beijerinckii]|uniref:Uncharacterized protein n=1 Tax=Azotobacter beijerinckii TaxID=170623 RepID=A0A1H6WQX9_9GAMM|nr:hypothetical protein [Azotobacter beijerinckii]SEJ16637.1 hypothetical protein SAMN04244579_03355 [Azotobacter beijerinckii]
MDKESVSRSRLFREAFLPGAFVRLRNHSYARVVGVNSQSGTAMEQIDKEQLQEAVLSFVRNWESAGGTADPAYRRTTGGQALEVQVPSEIVVSPAPLMLICRSCKVLDFYDTRLSDAQTLEKVHGRLRPMGVRQGVPCKRPGCRGTMIQLPYAAVHRCGHASALHLHHSARRPKNVGYQDRGAFFYSYFFDVDTGHMVANSLQGDCPHCSKLYEDRKGVNHRGAALTNGDTFYVQNTQYIALSASRGKLVNRIVQRLPQAGGALLSDALDIAEGLASALIGLITPAELEERLIRLLEGGTGDEAERAKKQKLLEKKQADLNKLLDHFKDMPSMLEDMASVLDSQRESIAQLETELASGAGQFKAVREILVDEAPLAALAANRRALEAVFLANDVNGLTVEDALAQASDAIGQEALRQSWAQVQNRYGIESIAHIQDLKVVLAALGFSREKNIPEDDAEMTPVHLNAFDDRSNESLRGRAPIYAMTATTEALWIRLDPRKVLAWCIEGAGWQVDDLSILENRARSQAYLLEACPALSVSLAQAGRIRREHGLQASTPFELLHSISHALMMTARRHTGYDAKSIQEYLLPMDMSVILYVTSVQNYTAGGLLTLFRHYLLPWLDDASMFAFNCAFDPVCSDNGSTCSGCLQIEIGCETLNHGLSRAYLHGGAADREGTLMITRGYWDA